MATKNFARAARATMVSDDKPKYSLIRDLSGGINTRLHGTVLSDKECIELENIDIRVPGETTKRAGSTLIANDVGSDDIIGLFEFEISGSAPRLLMYEDQRLYWWLASGNWTSIKSDFVAATEVGFSHGKMSGVSPDDVTIVQTGTNNAWLVKSDMSIIDLGNTAGTGSDSPPISTVMTWYGNRFWVLKNDLLYWSSAYSSDYSAAFDTVTGSYRVPVGDERALIATRDLGIVVFGKNEVWSVVPSTTPVATDSVVPLVTDKGCVSKNSVVQAADDIYWFAQDGVRSLRRNMQDKLQQGISYPISYNLKDNFESIDWSKADKIRGIDFNNRVMFSVPITGGTWETWVYYPATQGWAIITGWSPLCWEKHKVNAEEFLFYGKEGDGTVYKAYNGYTDEGTTETNGVKIKYRERSKMEDAGNPLIDKNGGLVEVKAKRSGNHTLSIYAKFNEGGETLLGTITLSTTQITFPTTFPVSFENPTSITDKFPIDSYGPWKTLEIIVEHDATNSTDEITVLSRSLATYFDEFEYDEV